MVELFIEVATSLSFAGLAEQPELLVTHVRREFLRKVTGNLYRFGSFQ